MLNVKKLSTSLAGLAVSCFSLGMGSASAVSPLVLAPDRAPRPDHDFYLAGDEFDFITVGEDTGGKNATFIVRAPGFGIGGVAPHVHYQENEYFYVLDGEVNIYQDDGTFNADGTPHLVVTPLDAGGSLYLAQGGVHAFKNVGDKEAYLLGISDPPGSTDKFSQAVGTPIKNFNDRIPTSEELYPPDGDLTPIYQVALNYDLNFLTPEPVEGMRPNVVVPPDQFSSRPAYDFLGGQYVNLLNTEESAGLFSVFNVSLPSQAGSGPMKSDYRNADIYYVLDGDVNFKIGDTTKDATKGTYIFLPTSTPYDFQNLGATPAKLLWVQQPESVPEPSYLLGLVGFGAYLGRSSLQKRKQQK